MTLVVDASVVVAALVDVGPVGRWAESMLTSDTLAAPHLMTVEAANILRRRAAARTISQEIASLVYADLVTLPCKLFPYHPFAARIWTLRADVTAYDSWYVALAESLDAALATLDMKLTRATGPACPFVTPPAAADMSS